MILNPIWFLIFLRKTWNIVDDGITVFQNYEMRDKLIFKEDDGCAGICFIILRSILDYNIEYILRS